MLVTFDIQPIEPGDMLPQLVFVMDLRGQVLGSSLIERQSTGPESLAETGAKRNAPDMSL